MSRRLNGKVILIAGGGGIGDALARYYAAEGASIVLGDLVPAGALAVADEIRSVGGQALGIELDGSDKDSVRAAIAATTAAFGGLDGLHVNFASFADGRLYDNVVGLPIDVLQNMVTVNMQGIVLCTQAAIPELQKRGGGAIVYTSSAETIRPDVVRPFYAMTKSTSHALMRHVALTWGPDNIRANVIAPGLIMHPVLAAAAGPEVERAAQAAAAIKHRVGNPTDIAALGALLLSEEGSYITGQIITVDGGTTMRP